MCSEAAQRSFMPALALAYFQVTESSVGKPVPVASRRAQDKLRSFAAHLV